MGLYVDFLGKKFGKLTVIGYQKGSRLEKKRAMRICLCDCGTTVLKSDKYLINTVRPSCGCHLTKETKVCPGCKEDKPKSQYHALKSKKCGIQTRCKKCISESRKKIYWSDRDAALKKMANSRNKTLQRRTKKTLL